MKALHTKNNFRTWKSGKKWLFTAGLVFTAVSVGAVSNGITTSADPTQSPDSQLGSLAQTAESLSSTAYIDSSTAEWMSSLEASIHPVSNDMSSSSSTVAGSVSVSVSSFSSHAIVYIDDNTSTVSIASLEPDSSTQSESATSLSDNSNVISSSSDLTEKRITVNANSLGVYHLSTNTSDGTISEVVDNSTGSSVSLTQYSAVDNGAGTYTEEGANYALPVGDYTIYSASNTHYRLTVLPFVTIEDEGNQSSTQSESATSDSASSSTNIVIVPSDAPLVMSPGVVVSTTSSSSTTSAGSSATVNQTYVETNPGSDTYAYYPPYSSPGFTVQGQTATTVYQHNMYESTTGFPVYYLKAGTYTVNDASGNPSEVLVVSSPIWGDATTPPTITVTADTLNGGQQIYNYAPDEGVTSVINNASGDSVSLHFVTDADSSTYYFLSPGTYTVTSDQGTMQLNVIEPDSVPLTDAEPSLDSFTALSSTASSVLDEINKDLALANSADTSATANNSPFLNYISNYPTDISGLLTSATSLQAEISSLTVAAAKSINSAYAAGDSAAAQSYFADAFSAVSSVAAYQSGFGTLADIYASLATSLVAYQLPTITVKDATYTSYADGLSQAVIPAGTAWQFANTFVSATDEYGSAIPQDQVSESDNIGWLTPGTYEVTYTIPGLSANLNDAVNSYAVRSDGSIVETAIGGAFQSSPVTATAKVTVVIDDITSTSTSTDNSQSTNTSESTGNSQSAENSESTSNSQSTNSSESTGNSQSLTNSDSTDNAITSDSTTPSDNLTTSNSTAPATSQSDSQSIYQIASETPAKDPNQDRMDSLLASLIHQSVGFIPAGTQSDADAKLAALVRGLSQGSGYTPVLSPSDADALLVKLAAGVGKTLNLQGNISLSASTPAQETSDTVFTKSVTDPHDAILAQLAAQTQAQVRSVLLGLPD
ncbi:MAG: KxYKxGKxW signal peptide domain-containing protein [Streptococcaceae bacterium]|jgi:hypothetical protein|nr:KxYKxGKxW signal peptide domain-containing protein [Streptococcaceae bacterium]